MGEVNERLEEGLPVLLLGDQIDAIDLANALLEECACDVALVGVLREEARDVERHVGLECD